MELIILAFALLSASLTLPAVGQMIGDGLDMVYSIVRLVILGVAFFLGVLAILMIAGLYFQSPLAVWTGFAILAAVLWLLSLIPNWWIWHGQEQMRRTAVWFTLFSLLALGTVALGIRPEVLVGLFTLGWLYHISVGQPRRALLLGLGAAALVLTLIPIEVMQIVGNRARVSVIQAWDEFESDTPAALLDEKRDVKPKFVDNELKRYQDEAARLVGISKTRSLTSAEWAELQEAEGQVARISKEFENKPFSAPKPAVPNLLLTLGAVAVLIALCIFAVRRMSRSPQPVPTPVGTPAATTMPAPTPTPPATAPSHPEPHGSSGPGLNWKKWGTVAVIFIAVIGILYLASPWLRKINADVMREAKATNPPPPTPLESLESKAKRRRTLSRIKEDTALYDAKGTFIRDVPKGTDVGFDPNPDLKNLDSETMVEVTIANDKSNLVGGDKGLVPWNTLGEVLPTPPFQPPPTPGYTLFAHNAGDAPVYEFCVDATGNKHAGIDSEQKYRISPSKIRPLYFGPLPLTCYFSTEEDGPRYSIRYPNGSVVSEFTVPFTDKPTVMILKN